MKPLYQNNFEAYQGEAGSRKVLKLDFNERSDSRPLWLTTETISTECLWKYPDKTGLEDQVAQYYGLNKEQLLLTNGGDEAIELLFKYACLQQRRLILPLPAFSQYLAGKVTWSADMTLIEPLDDMRIDLQGALSEVSEGSILIITSPNNPTGELISEDELYRVCQQAKEKNAQVFLDEAYIEFACKDEDYSLKLLEEFDNLIVLRTLSKAFGLAGIRCGYLLGQSKIVIEFARLAMPFNLPAPTIEVAKKAFTDSARLEVNNYAGTISQNREQVVVLLKSAGLKVVDSSANFLFIQGNENKLRLIKAACEKRNIIIKTELAGLSAKDKKINAIRITIPFYLKPLLNALGLALKPELICFDMDGVLIDTRQSYDQAIKATVEHIAGKTVEQSDIEKLRSKGGFNNDWVLSLELVQQSGYETDLNAVIDVFQSFYQGSEKNKGLKELEKPFIERQLSTQLFVTNTRTIKTAIVTGRPKDEAVEGARMIGANNCLVISDDDVEVSKPEPEGIIKALRYFGKENGWMLGDTPDDMVAANRAGVIAIGIGDESLYEGGADLVLDNVNQLESLL
ncbi:aminotransferase class I/II-fold pyridoxal phosphate-dependent enzyme [Kangiella sediminilitoris]|uniref:histidinol-phosphate transaminase n=1 Tax=Kangiella sediminilitoris TaxID=1144748 RepID=A0A1B3BBR9_9GAMM|nr:aminotransferase class I/II-fold pyridoxal phosphate-dependent enzyme [Kangiella sediminilitoris]AOE50233.1 HAD-superfamily hydrolase, subfamily IA, variant 1 [Kangiella sediminilitoris]